MTLRAGEGSEVHLVEGSIVISVDCLVPSRRYELADDAEIGRVTVPAEGSLKLPASFYALSKRDLARVILLFTISIPTICRTRQPLAYRLVHTLSRTSIDATSEWSRTLLNCRN